MRWVICLLMLMLCSVAYARSDFGTPAPLWEEEDGSPSFRARKIVTPNDTLVVDGNTLNVEIMNISSIDQNFVPYVNANADVNIGNNSFTVAGKLYLDSDKNTYFELSGESLYLYVNGELRQTWTTDGSGVVSFLLLETGDTILLETGDKIILE